MAVFDAKGLRPFDTFRKTDFGSGVCSINLPTNGEANTKNRLALVTGYLNCVASSGSSTVGESPVFNMYHDSLSGTPMTWDYAVARYNSSNRASLGNRTTVGMTYTAITPRNWGGYYFHMWVHHCNSQGKTGVTWCGWYRSSNYGYARIGQGGCMSDHDNTNQSPKVIKFGFASNMGHAKLASYAVGQTGIGN